MLPAWNGSLQDSAYVGNSLTRRRQSCDRRCESATEIMRYAVTDAESPSKGGLGGQGFLSSLASLFTGRQLSFSGRTVDKDLSSYNKRRSRFSSEGDAVLSCLDTAEPYAGKRWGTGSAEVRL